MRVRHLHRPVVRACPRPPRASAARYSPADPAATPASACARTGATSPARSATPRMTPGSAGRCARTATTTNPPWCSTPLPVTCGAASGPTCPRQLARTMGVTQKERKSLVRLRFVKVAEYQARGVVHFHAIIRLDAKTDGDSYAPPPARWTADVLAEPSPRLPRLPGSLPTSVTPAVPSLVRFGAQTDTKVIRSGTADALTRTAVANYIAKYATKTADAPGLPAYRLRSADRTPGAPLPAPLPAAHRNRLGTGLLAVGTLPRLRRALPHQIPPLLRHLRPAPRAPAETTAARSGTRRRTRPLGPRDRRNHRAIHR